MRTNRAMGSHGENFFKKILLVSESDSKLLRRDIGTGEEGRLMRLSGRVDDNLGFAILSVTTRAC